ILAQHRRPRAGPRARGPAVEHVRIGSVVEKSLWPRRVEENPEHSHWYVQRFGTRAAAGEDLHAGASLVAAMVPRGARVLDAGCGPGRVGGGLARRGHTVVGVDVAPVLTEGAEADHPGPTWLVQDLATLDLAAAGVTEPFDVVVSAGNVMTFLAPSTRGTVLRNLAAHLTPEGRLGVGFGA